MTSNDSLIARLERLERSLRRTQLLAGSLALTLLLPAFAGARFPNQIAQDVVRTKLLVVEDSTGRERIAIGAPMPDGRGYVGMKILDPTGQEQFGLGLKADGSVSMGFDTKPGVGNPANRERLNMGVTANGRGWIRFLDNATRAKMFILLDSAENGVVQFLDWTPEKRIFVKQHGFAGENAFEWK